MIKKLKYFFSLIIVAHLVFPNMIIAEEIRIAVRAIKGADKALEQWQATADYLTAKIPGYNFVLVPFDNNSALNEAISRGEFHFSLTNSASAIEHQIQYNTQPLATLLNKRQGKGYSRFGTVIFTRFDRNDINKLRDLKGKVFIGVDELAFGGWRIAWREFLQNNINPYTDFKKLLFAGGKQQKVVYTVRDGIADAGSVRTDMLEGMIASGKIQLKDFKIINKKTTRGFPFLHSSALYPEWPFSLAGKVETRLKNQVVDALLSIPHNGNAAKQGNYVGWIKPLDYSSVNALLKKLRVGPYQISKMNSFERLVSQYGLILLFVIFIIFLLTFIIVYMVNLNISLRNARDTLKAEIVTRKNLEQQLMHIQKMESLGELTGGIAHDFNNMLAIMLGFTELVLESDNVKNDSRLIKYLDQVMATGEKAKILVMQMLAFSRSEGKIDKTEIVQVSSIIDEVHQLLRPLLPSNIELLINKDKKESFINVSPVMINQVLMNLCINARDAMAGSKGLITISTEVIGFESALCNSCHKNFSGSYVAIMIEDTGVGIDEISIGRLFEPFYSTKDVGKGSGMGLSMAHGIIHQHCGHIMLTSEAGKGTIIKILLPKNSATQGTLPDTEFKDNFKTVANKSNKHILIVDDEVSITTYLTELLHLHGYKVTALNNSQDALNFFEENSNNIDLVITDQTMPNLTGLDIATQMLSISKKMPIILCTGYSENVEEQKAENKNIRAYMNKPIHSDELINTISSLL